MPNSCKAALFTFTNTKLMKENWVLVLNSPDLLQVKIARDVLKENGIESHIVNKPDSVMPMLGEAELYTLPDKAEQAAQVLLEHEIG